MKHILDDRRTGRAGALTRYTGARLLAALVLSLLLGGCVSPSPNTAAGAGPSAICQVCQHNNDLACVCVKVDDLTPRTAYRGTTYYFCSDDCKEAFRKQPEKYLGKR